MIDDSKLSEKTVVPISIAVAVIAAVLAFHVWLATQLADINNALRVIHGDLGRTWSKVEMSAWAYQLREKNPPSLIVPDPHTITRITP